MRGTAERQREALRRFDLLVELPPAQQAVELSALAESDPELAGLLHRMLEEDRLAAGPLEVRLAHLASTVVGGLAEPVDARHAENAAPPQIAGLEVGALLGRGGMGEVFLARRCGGGYVQRLALKLLRTGVDTPEVRRRFLRERRILAALEHPDIARFVDGGVAADGRPWFAMEFVEGQPITGYAREHRLDLRARVSLLRRVCAAVAFAQSLLVVHRDLKPSNILIDPQGRPRLLDFGIAKLLEDPEEPAETGTQQRALSPAYAAPEQWRDEPVSTATDVYALGLVLHELVTGRLPHGGVRSDRAGDLPALPSRWLQSAGAAAGDALGLEPGGVLRMARDLAGDLDLIIVRALRPEPALRYSGAAELGDDLQRWLDRRPVLARASSRGYRLRRFVSRHRAGVAAAAIGLCALLAALGVALNEAERAEREAERARQALYSAERSRQFLAGLFQDSSPTRQARGAQMTLAEFISDAAARVERELDGLPSEQAGIGLGLAFALAEIGDRGEALRLTEAAIERLRALHGPGSAALAEALHQRAGMLNDLGRPREAETDARDALAIFRSLPGGAPEGQLKVRTALLLIARSQGRYPEVLEESAAILELREQALGAEHPSLAGDWYNLGAVYALVERYADAEHAYRRADTLLRSDPRSPEARRAWILNGLGGAQLLQGDPVAAEASYAEAIEVAERTLGAEHAMVASALQGGALAARDRGDLAAALQGLRAAEAIAARNAHEMRARIAVELGVMLLETDRAEESASLLGPVAESLAAQAPQDPQRLRARASLALALARSGRRDDARQEADALDDPQQWPPATPQRYRAEAAAQLAATRAVLGEPQAADRWQSEADASLARAYPANHPRRQGGVRNGPSAAAD